MNASTKSTLIETRHSLSAEERRTEQAVLAGIGKHFANFVGSRREAYDTMVAQTPIAEGVTLESVEMDHVRGWWVRPIGAPTDRAILFLHGGAYMLGSAEAYRGFVSQIAIRVGAAAFALDYPLAPEHPFPAAYEAAVAALSWLGTQGIAQTAVIGDSCGAGLALATLARPAGSLPPVVAAILFSPWTDLALTGPSFTSPETHDPIFQRNVLMGAATAYLGAADPRDGRASPFYDIPDMLPPLAIQVGTDELLLDDARRYAAQAAEKGTEVRLDVFEGLHHVFQRSTRDLPSARRALDAAAGFLSAHWSS